MVRKRRRAKDKSTELQGYAFEQETPDKSADTVAEPKSVKAPAEEKKPVVKTAPPKATPKQSEAANRMGSFLKEVKSEMKKVNWPDQERTTQSTGVVIATLFVLSAVMSLFTMLFTWFAEYFFG